MKTFNYPHTRPFLAIESTGGGSLGNFRECGCAFQCEGEGR